MTAENPQWAAASAGDWDTGDEAPVDTGPQARFLGEEKRYWRLLVRGCALLMVTLGIYRFWLNTDMRRYLWSNTEIAGTNLEYSGTAMELLLGFLVAIALMIPVYVAFFVAALDLGVVGQLSGVGGLLLLFVLGQYAIYRARRYRLTRTIYRGVRASQHGSAVRYALYAALWWAIIILTAGLAYPFAQASLERYKLRNTFYGNLPGRFEGAGWRLFLRGLPMWLLVVMPLVASIVFALGALDWEALADALEHSGDDVMTQIENGNPQFAVVIVLLIGTTVWGLLAAVLFYPVFQGMALRWWLSGIRFGEFEVLSRLRIWPVYRVYLRFMGFALPLAILAGIAGFIGLAIIGVMTESPTVTIRGEISATLYLVVAYVAIALAFSCIYQVIVKRSLWKLAVESLEFTGLAALENVRVTSGPSSALGEGLADVLNVGGI